MTLLGVDVGGTFTDFYYWQDGRLEIHKRPSTPDDPSRSILDGLSEKGWRPDEVVHGSTVATNAVLERRGARTGFVATKGFRDLLTIGRQTRRRLYELEPRRPPALVPEERCFEVDERLDYRGEVLRELSDAGLQRLVQEVTGSDAEAVAVCLLFSFLSPEHERRIAAALRAAGLDVSASHEVLPEFREYERASTTALNAYVAPVVRRYLTALEAGLAAAGAGALRVIQSSGGTATAAQAAALPATTLLSGPAGGVAGAFAVARAGGYDQIITLDMGGTSTDVSLCPGRVAFTAEWSVSGLPVRLPSVDVHSVGAGGGSIARLDVGGALRVGPESAGALPGPACYGNGGPATVTDAHLAQGRPTPAAFLGGRFPIDAAAAHAALGRLLPDAVGAARGVIDVANAHMVRALRTVSVERGHDPRDFTLVAFGGAGPLHACDLAAALSIHRVLVPRFPGVLSAFGMAWADATRDASRTLAAAVPADPAGRNILETRIRAAVNHLAASLRRDMGGTAAIELAVDLRYAGQGYELTVDWDDSMGDAVAAFHAAHQRRFGHHDTSRPLEIVVVRARARIRREPPPFEPLREGPVEPVRALIGRRKVLFGTEETATVYDRERLLAGNVVRGPAIVEQMDSTTVVAPGWSARVDPAGNLVLEEA